MYSVHGRHSWHGIRYRWYGCWFNRRHLWWWIGGTIPWFCQLKNEIRSCIGRHRIIFMDMITYFMPCFRAVMITPAIHGF